MPADLSNQVIVAVIVAGLVAFLALLSALLHLVRPGGRWRRLRMGFFVERERPEESEQGVTDDEYGDP